jgi:hypothetical protein
MWKRPLQNLLAKAKSRPALPQGMGGHVNEFGQRINEYYEDKNGKLWKVVGYCAEPTVTLESVALTSDGRERLHIGADSPMAAEFTPLGTETSDRMHQFNNELFKNRNKRHGGW